VQEQRADIHAALLHRIDQHCGQRVDHDRARAEDHHGPARDFRRIDQSQSAFVDEIKADNDQRGVIDQRRDDLDPAIAEGHPLVRRPARDLARDEGDHQRRHVGEIVQGVGNEREAAGKNAADDLHHGQDRVRPDRDRHAAVAAFRIKVVVGMIVRHHAPPIWREPNAIKQPARAPLVRTTRRGRGTSESMRQ
jgi:hypothetical protein